LQAPKAEKGNNSKKVKKEEKESEEENVSVEQKEEIGEDKSLEVIVETKEKIVESTDAASSNVEDKNNDNLKENKLKIVSWNINGIRAWVEV
jgi:hypothetical protein